MTIRKKIANCAIIFINEIERFGSQKNGLTEYLQQQQQ